MIVRDWCSRLMRCGGARTAAATTASPPSELSLSDAVWAMKREMRKKEWERTEELTDWLATFLAAFRAEDDEEHSRLVAEFASDREEEARDPLDHDEENEYMPRPYMFPMGSSFASSRVIPPSAALFCDGTSNYFTQPEPTNIPILYSLVKRAFPISMDGRCLYFRGVGRDGADFVVAYSVVTKLKEIYWATCRALWPAAGRTDDEDQESPFVLDIFGFSRGALLARAVSHLFLRFGALRREALGPAAGQEDEDERRELAFRKLCDEVVDAFVAADPIDKTQFGRDGDDERRRKCVVRFLGIFDTVPGMSTDRAIYLGAVLPRRFLDEGEENSRIRSSLHLMAGNPTALFQGLSLYSQIPNFSLERKPPADVSCAVVRAHLEYRLPGDHCNIGGGWDTLADRIARRSIANVSLRAMLAASPYSSLALGPKLFPDNLSTDEWVADVRDSLACRPDLRARRPLPRAEVLQLVARNYAEIRYLPMRTPPLNAKQMRAEKARLKKNISELLELRLAVEPR